MDNKNTFEQSLQKLEEIVSKLENQDTPLEEAMRLFQQGVVLSDECFKQLENAKQAVHSLIEKNGEMQSEEFIVDEK